MRKILLAITLVVISCVCVKAQTDIFFKGYSNDYGDRTSSNGIGLPNGQGMVSGDIYGNDQPAPLGTGLLILSALGVGYTIKRRGEG